MRANPQFVATPHCGNLRASIHALQRAVAHFVLSQQLVAQSARVIESYMHSDSPAHQPHFARMTNLCIFVAVLPSRCRRTIKNIRHCNRLVNAEANCAHSNGPLKLIRSNVSCSHCISSQRTVAVEGCLVLSLPSAKIFITPIAYRHLVDTTCGLAASFLCFLFLFAYVPHPPSLLKQAISIARM
jgi:hypothetical protein